MKKDIEQLKNSELGKKIIQSIPVQKVEIRQNHKDNLKFQLEEKLKEQIKFPNIIFHKKSFFIWQNSFITSGTVVFAICLILLLSGAKSETEIRDLTQIPKFSQSLPIPEENRASVSSDDMTDIADMSEIAPAPKSRIAILVVMWLGVLVFIIGV